MFLSDEVLGNVEVTIITSKVKWCRQPSLFSHDGLFLSDEVLGNVEVTSRKLLITTKYLNHSKSAGQPSQCTRSLN